MVNFTSANKPKYTKRSMAAYRRECSGKNASASYDTDPAPQCLFVEGGTSLSDRYGPRSRECREWMSQRCAAEWDAACELASRNVDNFIPDEYTAFERTTSNGTPCPPTTDGEKHIRKTAEKRWCRFVGPDCFEQREMFDPNVPDSPDIVTYSGKCHKICELPKHLERTDEILLEKCAAKPGLCKDTLDRFPRVEPEADADTHPDAGVGPVRSQGVSPPLKVQQRKGLFHYLKGSLMLILTLLFLGASALLTLFAV